MAVDAGLVKPAFLSVPEFDPARSLGAEVAAVATLAGFPPDVEQRLLLDAAFAFGPDGKSVAFEVVVIAPRQNIKTGFFKQVALGHLFITDQPLVVWSAHEFDTASEALKDLEALIDGSDVLRRRVKKILHGSVPEIQLLSGARLKFKTRTSGGGRGMSGRKVILDEGYALRAAHTGALYPIMLAQPDPQLFIGSSACRPESEVLWDAVQRGRAGDPRMVYAEWCAPPPEEACADGGGCDHAKGRPGCGCDKPELLTAVHSAITRGRIQLETVMDMRNTLPAEEYGREVMGWHDSTVAGQPPIPTEAWADTEDGDSPMVEPSAFGVEVSLDRAWTSVGAAGSTADGRISVELIDRKRGIHWVTDRCVELHARFPHAVFIVDGGGPAGGLIPGLEAAGLDVTTASARDLTQACAGIVDRVMERLTVHGPQPHLDEAVHGAVKRPLGDGTFAFGRRISVTDIDALIAVTLAHWVTLTAISVRPGIRWL